MSQRSRGSPATSSSLPREWNDPDNDQNATYSEDSEGEDTLNRKNNANRGGDWLNRIGVDFEDLEEDSDVRDKIGPQLSFLSYRIPYVNIGILPCIAHVMQLIAIVACLLIILNMGLTQMPGEWLLIALTIYFTIYAVLALALYLTKPTAALAEQMVAQLRDRISDMNSSLKRNRDSEVIRLRSEVVQTKAYYRLQLRYAEKDSLHLNSAFAWHFIIGVFYWIWYIDVLGSNATIVCTSWPTACFSQFGLSLILFVFNYNLLDKYFMINKINMSELAGKKIVSLSRDK